MGWLPRLLSGYFLLGGPVEVVEAGTEEAIVGEVAMAAGISCWTIKLTDSSWGAGVVAGGGQGAEVVGVESEAAEEDGVTSIGDAIT